MPAQASWRHPPSRLCRRQADYSQWCPWSRRNSPKETEARNETGATMMSPPTNMPMEHSRQHLTTSSDPLKQSPNSLSCIAQIGSVETTLRTRRMTLATCLDIELPLSRATVWQWRYTLMSPGSVVKDGYSQIFHQRWRR